MVLGSKGYLVGFFVGGVVTDWLHMSCSVAEEPTAGTVNPAKVKLPVHLPNHKRQPEIGSRQTRTEDIISKRTQTRTGTGAGCGRRAPKYELRQQDGGMVCL